MADDHPAAAAHPSIGSLERRYVVLSALRWLAVGATFPVLVVLLTARGVAVEAIGPLLALYSVVVMALELPTGGLADRIGRRRVHVAASAVGVVSLVLFATAETTTAFAVSMLPFAVNRALLSGPLEAWFVDESHRVAPDADLDRAFARAESWAALALGAGALLTALLPQLVTLPEAGRGLIAPSLPIWVAAGLEVVHLAGAVVLMRPDAVGARRDTARAARRAGAAAADDGVPGSVRATVAAAIATARGPVLRRLLVAELVLATAMVVTEQVTPTDLVRLLGERDAASTYAVLAAVGFAVVSGGARLSAPLSSRLGPRRAYALAVAGIAVAVGLPGLLGTTPALALGYLLVYLGLGVRTPLRASVLHARVEGDRRATVLSVTSLVFQLGGLLASLSLLPLYAAAGRSAAFLAPAAVVALGAVLLGRPVDDRAGPPRPPLAPSGDRDARPAAS